MEMDFPIKIILEELFIAGVCSQHTSVLEPLVITTIPALARAYVLCEKAQYVVELFKKQTYLLKCIKTYFGV